MAAISPISALSAIISSAVANIDAAYAAQGVTFPSLDEPFRPSPMDGKVQDATNLIIAAAAQLIATVRPPPLTLLDAAGAMYSTASVGIVSETHTVEALREAGPKGMHIKDIGKKVGTDSAKLGRVLRYLAARHIFREVDVDVFANNRISSSLDSGKSLNEILAQPEPIYSNGLAATMGHFADESMKGCSFMVDHMLDATAASSQDPTICPMTRAFNTDVACFDWFEKPENSKRLRRFLVAMTSGGSFITPEGVLASYDWKSLQKNDLVVDVGGGTGSMVLNLAKALPDLRFVVQDRPAVVPGGIERFKSELPEALAQGRVKFQEHDFFKPQPIKDAAVFTMRFISHDWPDETLRKILKRLRSAAQTSTKLIILDSIVPYCTPTHGLFSDIPGAEVGAAPEPLLPNLGYAKGFVYVTDMQMMCCLNAQERTIGQFIDLVKGTGWKLDSISRPESNALSTLSALVFVTAS